MPFLKNTINSAMLGVRNYYIQGFHISVIPTTRENFKKNSSDMIQKFCMIWHGITRLKAWILQIQTTTDKIKLIGSLILGEIKFCNLKNERFEKKIKKLKNITILHFMTTFHNVTLKIETSFKLQSCLIPLWKLEKSMINVKT